MYPNGRITQVPINPSVVTNIPNPKITIAMLLG